MKISKVEIKNFKSIEHGIIDLAGLTIFVGANGSGKSNFLKALDFFYKPKSVVDSGDFFNRTVSEPIEIKVTFSELSAEELVHFSRYLSADNTLCVIKRFGSVSSTGNYYGLTKGCLDFLKLPRKPVSEFRSKYQDLRKQDKYKGLADATTAQAIEQELVKWETDNSDQLDFIEADTQFFGFENSSVYSLEKFTKFIYIPAVLYESHLEDSKSSPIGELTDILARHKLKEDEEIKKLEEEISKKYAEKLKPFNVNEMAQLSKGLTETLKGYYNGVEVKIQLDETKTDIKLPPPKAETVIKEGGYEAKIPSVGQGLQRAFILSLLQYFAENQAGPDSKDSFHLILGIDEPELYQHPSKQKLFYRILKGLSDVGSAVASSIQCCYTTHSALMIRIEDFDKIIKVYKHSDSPDVASITKVTRSSLQDFAKKEAELPSRGEIYPDLSTLSRMVNVIDSRVNEGFFADKVILVEGESDVVAIKAAARHYSKGKIDLDKLDIPIIDCGGKSNLEKPAIIFKLLNIATYLIWDSDYELFEDYKELVDKRDKASDTDKPAYTQKISTKKDTYEKSIAENKDLLHLQGVATVDWPAQVLDSCASFKYNLESTLKEELGEEYLMALVDKHNRKIQAKNPWKNPLVMTEVLNEAFSSGKRSETLEQIISKIA